MAAYSLPDLPYDYAALEPALSAQILELHHDKHHAAYVAGANTTLEKLEAARAADDYASIVGLEKTLAFNLSGHILHDIYWQNMSPDGGGEPEGDLSAQITEDFGSFAAFKKQLSQATTLVQGSGWGVLTYEPVGKKLLITQVYDHHANVAIGGDVLLVIDAWEHAYYLQYKNVRADYVEKFWDVVNWQDVAARYAASK